MARDNTVLRNIGIAAHIDAGKTTVPSESLLHRPDPQDGEVHEGTTVTDFDEEERARGITIYSAAISAPWLYEHDAEFLYGDKTAEKVIEQEDKKQGIMRNGVMHQINVIDTPGHVDFTAEVERSLRVLDGAIAVFDGKEGVEAQSETVWRQATKVRRAAHLLHQQDGQLGADFNFSFNSIHERLERPRWPCSTPSASQRLRGHDRPRARRRVPLQGENQGTEVEEKPIDPSRQGLYEEWREKLVAACADIDDTIAEKYLEGEEVTRDEIKAAVRKGTISFKMHPVFLRQRAQVRRRPEAHRRRDRVPAQSLDVPAIQAHDANDPDKIVERHCDPPSRSAG